jgi:hypothetical protein
VSWSFAAVLDYLKPLGLSQHCPAVLCGYQVDKLVKQFDNTPSSQAAAHAGLCTRCGSTQCRGAQVRTTISIGLVQCQPELMRKHDTERISDPRSMLTWDWIAAAQCDVNLVVSSTAEAACVLTCVLVCSRTRCTPNPLVAVLVGPGVLPTHWPACMQYCTSLTALAFAWWFQAVLLGTISMRASGSSSTQTQHGCGVARSCMMSPSLYPCSRTCSLPTCHLASSDLAYYRLPFMEYSSCILARGAISYIHGAACSHICASKEHGFVCC